MKSSHAELERRPGQRHLQLQEQEAKDRKVKLEVQRQMNATKQGSSISKNNDELKEDGTSLSPPMVSQRQRENRLTKTRHTYVRNIIKEQFQVCANAGDSFIYHPISNSDYHTSHHHTNNKYSSRPSVTTQKIHQYHDMLTHKLALKLALRTNVQQWMSSFYRCDPRYQIMKFFDEVAREGGDCAMDENVALSWLATLFDRASVFTVWRPTSMEAIKNMMLGVATGKGLDIKGKSAKKGNISSYVPFIQIYEEQHKDRVWACLKENKTIRVFYQSEEARGEAYMIIYDIAENMQFAAEDGKMILADESSDIYAQELAYTHLRYDDSSFEVKFINDYVGSTPPAFGLDIPEKVFWKSYVSFGDCSRPRDTEWDIGRPSAVEFMDMNLKATRNVPAPGEPRAVVYQMSKCGPRDPGPMEPRMLLMAYEENGSVKPVVSDFDCFLIGSRGVKYEEPISDDQVSLLKWSVKNIGEVLDERARDKTNSSSKEGWMQSWLDVHKKAALTGFYPKIPKYGNGDPKSYEIVKVAVSRLKETGCVRHGAECFNWWFPQDIDEEFLVISDTLPGNIKWKYVKVPELQELLITKIDDGFTFPINPKWVLCDPGWRRVFDKLLASQKPNVQDSINCWLPPETGLREEIDAISARHTLGFEGAATKHAEGTEEMDLMENSLEEFVKLKNAVSSLMKMKGRKQAMKFGSQCPDRWTCQGIIQNDF